MAGKMSYRDLSHPNCQDTLKSHNHATLKLVKTVAEFAQKVSLAHEQFANQILNVVEAYKKKNQELKKERPVDCPSSLSSAWETLLQETQYDGQAHADTATLIMKNVYSPLLEIASYKRSQSKKLYQFRENFESMLSNAEDNVYKCHNAYIEAYQNHRSNSSSRDAARFLASYHNAHNDYILQIRASNRQEGEYHQMALPYLLQELEEIHIDLANTLNGAIESHALLLLTKANEQSRRFEGILRTCKSVNPKMDVHNFIVCVSQESITYEPKEYIFDLPSDPNIPGSELGTLKDHMIFDRHTEVCVKAKRMDLQREASELTSYLKQNQDVTQTLMNVCQRNLANHLHAKVYETQEDLCRKRNEIRVANLQLAAIRAQIDQLYLTESDNSSSEIELLSPKQNGNTSVEADSGKHNKATIKGMWKKAFKSLKSKDREKDEKTEKPDKADSKYSKLPRGSSHHSSGHSHESSKAAKGHHDSHHVVPESPIVVHGADAALKERRPSRHSKTSKAAKLPVEPDYSRQSSLKRVLKRKDSKEAPSDGEPATEDVGDMDPVFTTLRAAMSMRRSTGRSLSGSDNDMGHDMEPGSPDGFYQDPFPRDQERT